MSKTKKAESHWIFIILDVLILVYFLFTLAVGIYYVSLSPPIGDAYINYEIIGVGIMVSGLLTSAILYSFSVICDRAYIYFERKKVQEQEKI